MSLLVSVVFALAAFLPGAGAPQQSDAAAQTGLAGTWQLDRESSNLPSPDAMGRDRQGGMRGRPPGSGPGGRPPGMGGGAPGGRRMPGSGGERSRPSEEEIQHMRDLMQEALEAPRRMTIARDGKARRWSSKPRSVTG